MNKQGILHPRMLQHLRQNFFPSCCTIQSRTEVLSPTGHAAYTFTNVYVNVACRHSPALRGERGRGQTDTAADTYDKTTHDIALNGRYVVDITMRAVIDDVAYDIVRVDLDDQSGTTVLRTKLVL